MDVIDNICAGADDLIDCPSCEGIGNVEMLGALGNTCHFRCRACGWTFPVIALED